MSDEIEIKEMREEAEYRPLIRGGTLGRVIPPYLIAFVPTLALLIGLMLGIETIVHYTMSPHEDPNIKAFGIPFNAASPVKKASAAAFCMRTRKCGAHVSR